MFNPLNAELNPICHLLALLGGANIVVVSRLRVKHGLKLTARTPRHSYAVLFSLVAATCNKFRTGD